MENLPAYDCHCHILPGLDDGAQTLEEALFLAGKLASYGFRRAVCTSHRTRLYPNTPETVVPACERLQEAIDKAGIRLQLIPSMEYRLIPETWPEARAKGWLLPWEGNHILVELPISNPLSTTTAAGAPPAPPSSATSPPSKASTALGPPPAPASCSMPASTPSPAPPTSAPTPTTAATRTPLTRCWGCRAVPEPVDAVAGRSLSLSKGRPGPVFRQTLHLARGAQHAFNRNLLNINELYFVPC